MNRKLTRTELRVLKRVFAGKKNKEIGEELHICQDTLRTHLKSIYRKMGFRRYEDGKREKLVAMNKFIGMSAAPDVEGAK